MIIMKNILNYKIFAIIISYYIFSISFIHDAISNHETTSYYEAISHHEATSTYEATSHHEAI